MKAGDFVDAVLAALVTIAAALCWGVAMTLAVS